VGPVISNFSFFETFVTVGEEIIGPRLKVLNLLRANFEPLLKKVSQSHKFSLDRCNNLHLCPLPS